MEARKVRFLFIMSLLELIAVYGCIMYSYMKKGNVPVLVGAAGLILLACSFVGSVYGLFERKNFKENHNYIGLAAMVIHLLVFLGLFALYIAGMLL